jgi:hypothetical protein
LACYILAESGAIFREIVISSVPAIERGTFIEFVVTGCVVDFHPCDIPLADKRRI